MGPVPAKYLLATFPPMKKGDPKVIWGWTMYDWANSVYSLTITTAIFPVFFLAITHDGDTDLVKERYGLPSQSLYSYALSAGFLLVALITPLLSGIADHTGSKKSFLKAFCYLGAASCAGLFFFGMDSLWLGLLLVMFACAGFSGSLIVAEFDSLAAAQAWADADPYIAAGVYDKVIVKPFKQVLP
jgi:UMF1 family MFS transporter